ncbi:MAG: hypothetical protein ACKVP0_24165 [Pirellulaceae bacterium]
MIVNTLSAQENAGRHSLESKITEVREQLSQQLAERVDKLTEDRQLTVEAIVAIIQAEEKKIPESPLYHLALKKLGHFVDRKDAVRVLVDHIDAGMEAGPSFGSPIQYCTAAKSLIESGRNCRAVIFGSLGKGVSDRKLHLMAYVLVELDQDAPSSPYNVELTLLRLRREIELVEATISPKVGTKEPTIANLRKMISLIEKPTFPAERIPPK